MQMPKIDFDTFRRCEMAFLEENHITVAAFREGYAKFVMPLRDDMINPFGTVSGGHMYQLAESVSGFAANSYGKIYAAAGGDFHYIHAGTDSTILYAEARVIKRGRRMMVTVVDITDDNDTFLAEGCFSSAAID